MSEKQYVLDVKNVIKKVICGLSSSQTSVNVILSNSWPHFSVFYGINAKLLSMLNCWLFCNTVYQGMKGLDIYLKRFHCASQTTTSSDLLARPGQARAVVWQTQAVDHGQSSIFGRNPAIPHCSDILVPCSPSHASNRPNIVFQQTDQG